MLTAEGLGPKGDAPVSDVDASRSGGIGDGAKEASCEARLGRGPLGGGDDWSDAPARTGSEERETAGDGEQGHVTEPSDAELMRASLRDAEAFGAIFDRHGETLLRYLGRRAERPVAESLLGELFRIAFERRARFDPEQASARPWLYGIASNLLLKHRRSESRRLRATARLLVERTPAPDPGALVHTRVDARLVWPSMADALEALPEAERDALLLHVWEGLSYEEVAAAQDVPVGTVRSRIHRARARLRELVPAFGKDRDETRSPKPARTRS